jgi:hypothetical protein
MKKIVIFVLSLVLCIGLFTVSKAVAEQNPTICAVHPFTGRFAFAGIHGADAMEDAVSTKTMWVLPLLSACMPSISPIACLARAPA